MQKHFLLPILMGLFFLVSCGSNSSKYSQDAEGFAKIQEDFMSKFGADSYYTDISIINVPGKSHGSGLSFNVIVTKDPSSLKMDQWTYNSYSNWVNTAEVSLEMGDDSDPKDFMFQLGGKFDLRKVGELVQQSAKKLKEDKKIENASLNMAMLKTPDDDDVSTTKIVIMMQPENGGTTFTFNYDLDGNLVYKSY